MLTRLVQRVLVSGCLVLLFEIPTVAIAAPKIEIEFADWGFDGRAVPRAFNLLTLGVHNSSDEPFEGTLRCRRVLTATGGWSGAEILQKVYVGPSSTRIVQFYPYMLDEGEEWEVRWGDGLEDAFVTERPQLTSGSRVLFNDPLKSSGIQPGLKGFVDTWFPVNVIAADALRLAVLDHSPRWETARRDVFRDWLFRGGILHVLQQPDGAYPELPVSELNNESRPDRFGAGRIYWHDRTRDELTKEYVYETMYSTSQDLVAVVDSSGSTFDIDPTSVEFIRRDEEFFEAYAQWDSDNLIPRRLKEFLRPNHEWSVIYPIAGLYLLLLFPGGYLLARSRLDYRYSLGTMVLVVGLFSWIFSIMGARGYGESTSTFSVATARQLPDGRWDVEQWNSLFVTDGDDYSLSSDGEFQVYSAADNVERVAGFIENGRDGRFSVDMPPFTFRTFVMRTAASLGNFTARVVQVQLADSEAARNDEDEGVRDEVDRPSVKQLAALQVECDGVLSSRLRGGFVLYGDSLYPLNLEAFQSGSGNILAGAGVQLVELIDLTDRSFRFQKDEIGNPEKALNRFPLWLIARDLQLRRHVDARFFTLPTGEARVYVHADLPEQLACRNATATNASFGNQNGRILYRLDLSLPDAADK
ncbi:MAG: hypothetical protein O3B86_06870 [Planctomycetota bacterium]|nr:hypothetical protein [Planctomycetota bacterium]